MPVSKHSARHYDRKKLLGRQNNHADTVFLQDKEWERNRERREKARKLKVEQKRRNREQKRKREEREKRGVL